MVMKIMAVLVSVLPRIHMANQQADTMKINLKVSANISFDCAHVTFVGDLIIWWQISSKASLRQNMVEAVEQCEI